MALTMEWYNTATADFDAKRIRRATGYFAGASSSAHASRSGVRYTDGNDLKVTVSSMTATVAPGEAFLDSPTAWQGGYVLTSDANEDLTIPTRHASLTRIDTVYARITDDQVDSSGTTAPIIGYVQGTASGSPTAPALPSHAIRLADITVPPGVGTIQVNDSRRYTAALGGVIPCQSTVRPLTVTKGQRAYELDTGREIVWDGSFWQITYDPTITWQNLTLASGFVSSGGATPQYWRDGDWVELRGRIARNAGDFVVNTTYTALTLPAALWPDIDQYFHPACEYHTTGGGVRVELQQINGQLQVASFGIAKSWFALDGIHWTPGQ